MDIIYKSSIKAKGTHIISICDARNDSAKKISDQIEELALKRQFLIKCNKLTAELSNKLWCEYRALIKYLHDNFLLRQLVIDNITTTIGRAVFARRLSGNTTYTGIVNYTALGSSNVAPVIGDATLGTEVYRKALTSGTYSNNIAYLETFFTATETTGTYEEYGMFIDGGAGANTGQLFNRFITTTVKSNTETMNVQSIVTISDA